MMPLGDRCGSRLCHELEDCGLLFVEEPVLPEHVDALVTVARSAGIPIATGERLFTRWGFRQRAAFRPMLGYRPSSLCEPRRTSCPTASSGFR
jgi:hypothetical protein